MSTIVRLESENVKRLRAVSITPTTGTVVVGGRNGQGKSSLLDSIAMALAGKDAAPSAPVRRGEKAAKIVLETQDIIVTRKFTAAGGTSLEVTNKQGLKFPSPQAVLDKLCTSIAFDPLAFIRASKKDQLAQLRALVGVDTTKLDTDRKALFDERTVRNRESKAQTALVEALPMTGPAAVSVQALMGELDAISAHNRQRETLARDCESATNEVSRSQANVESGQRLIADLESKLATARAGVAKCVEECEAAKGTQAAAEEKFQAMELRDPAPVKQRIADAEGTNREAAKVEQRKREADKLAVIDKAADELTKKIEALDKQRTALLAGAKFPVAGLGFDEQGVTLDELPLDQASSAEQLRVGLAIACSMNPELRVMLIRDGSLLDSDSMAIVEQMAADHHAQVWIERVGDDGKCTVVIEDGEAVTEPQAPAKPKTARPEPVEAGALL